VETNYRSVHWPWAILICVGGAIVAFGAWATLQLPLAAGGLRLTRVVLAGALGLAALGALVALIERARRQRGLLARDGRQAALAGAMLFALVVALGASLWPPAPGYDWLSTLATVGALVLALALGWRLARNGTPARFRQAQRAYADGASGEALEILSELADERPDFYGADQLRAQIAREQGDYAAALAAGERLIALRPDLYHGYAEQGLTLLAQGQPGRASEPLARAAEAAPHLAIAHFNLGMAYAEAKQPEPAARALSRALRLGLRDEVTQLIARYQLHGALQALGHTQAAARELARLRRSRGVIRRWRMSLPEGPAFRVQREHDLALSAAIERLIHS
jgi:tetratricopeptide (TPR) repeat protein